MHANKARNPSVADERETCFILQGQGMVLGMGDTGLDFDHCHFADSAVPIPYTVAQGLSRESGSGIPYFQNATHRKVRTLSSLCIHINLPAVIPIAASRCRLFVMEPSRA